MYLLAAILAGLFHAAGHNEIGTLGVGMCRYDGTFCENPIYVLAGAALAAPSQAFDAGYREALDRGTQIQGRLSHSCHPASDKVWSPPPKTKCSACGGRRNLPTQVRGDLS